MPFNNKVFQLIIESKITALPWLRHADSFVCDRTTMSHNESLLRKLVEVKCFIPAKYYTTFDIILIPKQNQACHLHAPFFSSRNVIATGRECAR